MSSAREDVWCEAYDPSRVSWQTEQLYRIEAARRALKAARQLLLAALADHRRYEDEARQRAMALRVAVGDRAARRRVGYRPWSEARWKSYYVVERRRWERADEARRAVVTVHGGYKARDAWICGQFVAGKKRREIAEMAKVSVERVRQICLKWERRRLAWWLG